VGALGGQTLTRNEASDGCHSIAQLVMSDLPVQTSTGMRGGIPTRPAANLIQPGATEWAFKLRLGFKFQML
jgi:hypothetical protein